jgi:hypothetical protein
MEQLDLAFFFKTKAEAADFSIRLAAITEEVYRTDFNLDQALIKHLGIQKKDKMTAMFRDNNINIGSNSEIMSYFAMIQEIITAMPVVTITMAIEPPEETLQAMSEWFLLNTNQQVLFDIRVDPKLIAGITLTFKGKYKDFSIRQMVERVIADTNASHKDIVDSVISHQSIEHITFTR